MKAFYLQLVATVCLLTFSSDPSLHAQTSPAQPNGAIGQSGPASAVATFDLKRGAQATALMDMRVNNRQGDVLGTVRDFAMDLHSTKLVYVLVASQGATVHPVPPEALVYDPAQGNAIVLDISRDQFEHSPSFQNTMPPNFSQDSEINQVYGFYHQQWAGRTAQFNQAGAPTGRPASADLSLVTGLLGQPVTVGQLGSVGQISDLFVDLKAGVWALIVGGSQSQASLRQ